ncbi:catalase family peroxidase [Planotetraspora phitsanulokensis]|uniref:Catalase-related peroxidase n=1 Tax=Planotetraspora phitsanulokensis TaxID=575192 RepID=A0A8J3UB62_9ACTN|nr:catalase family peroxidase [Planotetraspora phitsanulokensis]GII41567.1 catalase-related peroxidase [Planotetraspora phitsanulokensis]
MSSDTAVPPTAVQVVDSMERMSGGTYPGHRRSGARGVCFTGTFTPTGDAEGLTTAAHLQRRTVPVTVRFSNSEGDPQARDGVPVARGMATRFALPDDGHTDLIALSVPVFVASTPEEFFTLTKALRPDAATGHPDPARVQAFVAAHPHLAGPIMQQPPVPVSYGTAAYWAIHAFIWVDAAGNRQPVRYRWEPEAGRVDLTAEEAATQADHYLTAEIHERVKGGPVAFTLQVQLGEEDDPTHDPTVAWPDGRKEITAGRLELTGPVHDQEQWAEQGFNPTGVTAGIELSDDPVLAFRAGAYPESFRRRNENR